MEINAFFELVRSAVVVMPDKGFRQEIDGGWNIVELGGELDLRTPTHGALVTGLPGRQAVPAGTKVAVAVRNDLTDALHRGFLGFMQSLPKELSSKLRRGLWKRFTRAKGLTFIELGEYLGSITLAMGIAAIGEVLGEWRIHRPTVVDLILANDYRAPMLAAWWIEVPLLMRTPTC